MSLFEKAEQANQEHRGGGTALPLWRLAASRAIDTLIQTVGAVVFDTVADKTNIRSARPDFGSIDNTKRGITQLGTNSSATGDYATVVGGNDCSAAAGAVVGGISCLAADNGVALGINCDALDAGAVAIGSHCHAGSGGAVALGLSNSALGSESLALGGHSTAQGLSSAIGHDCTGIGQYSTALGRGALSIRTGELVHSSTGTYDWGSGAPLNSSQDSSLTLRGQTPGQGAGETVILTPDGVTPVILPAEHTTAVEVYVVARLSSGAARCKFWKRRLLVDTLAQGVVPTVIGTIDDGTIADGTAPPWTLTISVSSVANQAYLSLTVSTAGDTVALNVQASVFLVELGHG